MLLSFAKGEWITLLSSSHKKSLQIKHVCAANLFHISLAITMTFHICKQHALYEMQNTLLISDCFKHLRGMSP